MVTLDGIVMGCEKSLFDRILLMDEHKGGSGSGVPYSSGWQMRCHQCGEILPLLHPHIVAERYDEDENMICEYCFERRLSES